MNRLQKIFTGVALIASGPGLANTTELPKTIGEGSDAIAENIAIDSAQTLPKVSTAVDDNVEKMTGPQLSAEAFVEAVTDQDTLQQINLMILENDYDKDHVMNYMANGFQNAFDEMSYESSQNYGADRGIFGEFSVQMRTFIVNSKKSLGLGPDGLGYIIVQSGGNAYEVIPKKVVSTRVFPKLLLGYRAEVPFIENTRAEIFIENGDQMRFQKKTLVGGVFGGFGAGLRLRRHLNETSEVGFGARYDKTYNKSDVVLDNALNISEDIRDALHNIGNINVFKKEGAGVFMIEGEYIRIIPFFDMGDLQLKLKAFLQGGNAWGIEAGAALSFPGVDRSERYQPYR